MVPSLTLPLTWTTMSTDILHLGLAYVLALPVGWNRERHEHSAGLRTFPIVAVASCGFAMLGASLPGADSDSSSRLLQGLITGIGFIGGGAILRDRGSVIGTATAASVWCIGIVGAAVGFGLLHIAIVLAVINWLTLRLLTPLTIPPDNGAHPNPTTKAADTEC